MSYSTSNTSSTVSVTNFGVKLDGITDNRAPLQGAIDTLSSRGGGQLYFPAGRCYWSGTLNVTGNNIGFVGDNRAVLAAAIDESAKKINISGARNVYFDSLTIDGGKRAVTANVSNQLGFISTVNSENVRITNCDLSDSFNSLVYLGGGTRFVNISNNYFSGHFCGIYSYINNGESGSQCFTIDSNRFGNSWCSGSIGESACIKLQASYSQPYVTEGHVVTNNVIDSPMQMGIELWSRGRNNTVSNNTIKNTVWGISLDGQEDCVIGGNTIRNVPYAGIELASQCRRNVIDGNSINGYNVTGGLNVSRIMDYGVVLSNTACEDNVISNNSIVGAGYGLLVQNAINTTISDNIIKDCDQSIDIQAASLIKAHGNLFDVGSMGTNYHLFFDASNTTLSGFHFSDNKFRGATTQQSIFYYNNGNPYTVRDICFENNVTDGTTAGGYGIFIGGQLTPTNYVYRDNFGPTGSNGANSIQDASDSSSYTTSDIFNGYSYYGSKSWTVPAQGVTGNGVWLCVWSGGGGTNNLVRVRAYNPPINDASGNWGSHIYEITASMAAYEGGFLRDSLMVGPTAYYNGDIIQEVHTQKHDTSTISNSVWIKTKNLSTSWAGQQLAFSYSQANSLTGVYSTYAAPAWKGGTQSAVMQYEPYSKVSDGFILNNGSYIYSPQSGILVLSGHHGISLANATEISGLRSTDPVLKVTNLSDFTYLDTADFLAPNLSVGNTVYFGLGTQRSNNNQFSFGMYNAGAGSSSNRFDINAYGTPALMSVKVDGDVGVNTTNPSSKFHVVGSTTGSTARFDSQGNGTRLDVVSATSTGYWGVEGNRYLRVNNQTGNTDFIFAALHDDGPNGGSYVAIRSYSGIAGTDSKQYDMYIGYNSGANYAYIDVVQEFVAYNNLSILPNGGNVGLGTTRPGSKLHVNGSVCLSGISTATSASAGVGSALPATPVGYVTINITGGNFKIPYYNA